MTPGLWNAPGEWRWEQQGDAWWRVNDDLHIEDGPHTAPPAEGDEEAWSAASTRRIVTDEPWIPPAESDDE